MERIERRSFLRRTGRSVVAGSTLLSAAPLAWTAAPGANERVRLAVLGVRGRGRAHAGGFAAIDGVEVAAVCDPDERVHRRAVETVVAAGGREPRRERDLRRVLEDRSLQAVTVATPDHWHALATIWACQAGKDVYVEKPCSYCIREGRKMVQASRRYRRIVQHGTQSRSGETFLSALEYLRSKPLGAIRVAKVINSQLRADIGHREDAPVPEGVDYDLWLGPAPRRPFNPNRFHYNWHWNWDYGTGDLGNDSVHAVDYARWFLGVEDPLAVSASGTKLHFDDDQETPDTQNVVFEFDGVHLIFEMRIWTPYGEHGFSNGAVFYGEKGSLEISPAGWRTFFPRGEPGPSGRAGDRQGPHFRNFVECVRTREKPNADIREGYLSSRLCHLGNIATRVGRRLRFEAASESFPADEEANRLLGRRGRAPFSIPEEV